MELNDGYKLDELALHLGVSHIDASVTRLNCQLKDGTNLSALKWFDGEPEIVFLHGGGQNAHTWDMIALLLRIPMIAFDLPGHGYSDWREDKEYWPVTNAERIAEALDGLNFHPKIVVGMSLGGLTAIRLSAIRPDYASKTVVIDVTPNQSEQNKKMKEHEHGTTALIRGQRTFASQAEMIEATQKQAPLRSRLLIERGVINNSRQQSDGSWMWLYDELTRENEPAVDFSELWDDVRAINHPLLLVIGGDSAFVHSDDRQKFEDLCSDIRVEVVAKAGHSVQSDQPHVLAEILLEFFEM